MQKNKKVPFSSLFAHGTGGPIDKCAACIGSFAELPQKTSFFMDAAIYKLIFPYSPVHG